MPEDVQPSAIEVNTIDATEAQKLQADVTINQDPVIPSIEAEAEPDYDELTLPELRDELKKRDLPTSGNKPELITRLKAAPADADSYEAEVVNGGIEVDVHANAAHSDVLQSLSDDRKALQLKGTGRV